MLLAGLELRPKELVEASGRALAVAVGGLALPLAIGMHFILGAFMAGLFFGRQTVSPEGYKSIRSSLTSITMGFFAPLFFASVGLQLDLSAAVELTVAGIALQAGLFSHPDPTPPAVKYLFSAIVIMAMVTTLLTPIAQRPLLSGRKSD